MTEIQFRDANAEDILVIHLLANRIWPVVYDYMISQQQIAYMLEMMYSESALRDQMVNKNHQFILIIINDESVGYASYSHVAENHFRLHKLYLLPESQGSGSGKRMLNHILERMQKEGGTSIELSVNRNNRSLHFYKRQGFEILREEPVDIGGGFVMDDYVMEKKL